MIPLAEMEAYCTAQLGRHDSHTYEYKMHKSILTSLRALQAAQPASDEVLIAIKRPEGYEDVHPDLIIHDAMRDGFEVRIIPTPPIGAGGK